MGRAGEGSLNEGFCSALVHASTRGCSSGPCGPPGVSSKDLAGKQIPEQTPELPIQGVQPSKDSPAAAHWGVSP